MKIPVRYQPAQVAPMQGGSPSAEKPKYVVESWLEKFGNHLDLTPSRPASVEMITAAHDKQYVEDVLACREANGFGTKSKAVAASLPYTVGSFVDAAKDAVRNGKVAVSPTSGFHHACYYHGGGFCTFNGLMVAAMELQRLGYVGGSDGARLAILDCDFHYGNGTDDIIHMFMGGSWISHFTSGLPGYSDRDQPADFMRALRKTIRRFYNDGARVLFYQAGADAHIKDPLGGLLTTEELRERDRIVFDACNELGLPVVWNLAGGYQTVKGREGADYIRPVLNIHDNTMRECVAVFGNS